MSKSRAGLRSVLDLKGSSVCAGGYRKDPSVPPGARSRPNKMVAAAIFGSILAARGPRETSENAWLRSSALYIGAARLRRARDMSRPARPRLAAIARVRVNFACALREHARK